MKVMLKYIALPMLAFVACGLAVKFAWSYSPTLVLSVLGVLILIGFAEGLSIRHRNQQRGWRVGHIGRDEMFYEEMIGGKWERILISGETCCGDAHHVIYFPSEEQWESMPEWTRGRQLEIVSRIKKEFKPPGYEYQESEQLG